MSYDTVELQELRKKLRRLSENSEFLRILYERLQTEQQSLHNKLAEFKEMLYKLEDKDDG